MTNVNFGNAEAARSYSPMPKGFYIYKIHEIEEDFTENHNKRWKISLIVASGKFKGRKVNDKLIFTEKTIPLIKNVYEAVGGFDLTKSHNCEPMDIKGKYIEAETVIDTYIDQNGDERQINKIAYGGYLALSEETKGKLKEELLQDKKKEKKEKAEKSKAAEESEEIGDEEIPF